ncbi:MAG TPA: CAP domain-containing protein [Acidimicrobiia bacterium]
MSSRRVLGAALTLFLLVTTFALSQKPGGNTSVLGEGASLDPRTYAEFTTTSTDEEYSFKARLGETTTTEYITTTSTVPAETTTTAGSAAGGSATPTTNPSSGSPTTTAPPSPTTTTTESAGGYNSGYESSFVAEINSLRAANGLASLARNGSLDAEAREWSKSMAEQGSLSHSDIGRLIPPWSSVAENVGSGPSVSAIFGALVGSPTHLDHMLGEYDVIGVGVWVDSNGTLWTTHIFAK